MECQWEEVCLVVLILDKNKKGTAEKHFKHATADGMVAMYLGDRPGAKRVHSLPICPKCERIGLRDKGWKENMIMTCPFCAYNGPTDTVYSEYMRDEKFL